MKITYIRLALDAKLNSGRAEEHDVFFRLRKTLIAEQSIALVRDISTPERRKQRICLHRVPRAVSDVRKECRPAKV